MARTERSAKGNGRMKPKATAKRLRQNDTQVIKERTIDGRTVFYVRAPFGGGSYKKAPLYCGPLASREQAEEKASDFWEHQNDLLGEWAFNDLC